MAYDEDIRALERLERARLFAIVAAVGVLVLPILLGLDWLDWPRALAWTAAAVVCLLESRVLKRMGRSPHGAYLRAALFFPAGSSEDDRARLGGGTARPARQSLLRNASAFRRRPGALDTPSRSPIHHAHHRRPLPLAIHCVV